MSNPNKITASYDDLSEFPKMVFGVMGSAGGEVPESAREKIYVLGAEVGKRGYTVGHWDRSRIAAQFGSWSELTGRTRDRNLPCTEFHRAHRALQLADPWLRHHRLHRQRADGP